jgi:tetratricopeptide (TPR) repeat protein
MGRAQLLDRIQSALRDKGASTTKRKQLVITGLGGIGKSEMCLQIANIMRQDFWGVFWVDVDNPSTAKNGYMAVAKALGSSANSIEDSVLALASTQRRWLLILDNADDPALDYARYIPSGVEGTVIITSRIPQCSRYSTVPAEALEGLGVEHSVHLLLKAATVPEEQWQSCDEQAQEIVRLLGSHTLALIQAGAYIAEGYCQLAQYAEKYKRQRKRLLEHYPGQEQSRYRDVYATFEASADVLRRSKDKAGQDALDLLGILAMVHSSVLPLQLCANAWLGAQDVLQNEAAESDETDTLGRWHVSQLPDFIEGQADEWDDDRLKKASVLLASLSLVTKSSMGAVDGLSMHPLAHAWARDRLQKQQYQQTWVSAGCVLALSLQKQTWRIYEKELRSHVQSFLAPSVSAVLSFGPQKQILAVLLECGWALNTMREGARLEALLADIYRQLQITPEDPSKEYVAVWELAGTHVRNMGHARQAVALLEHVVKIKETTLAETHPYRLGPQHALAIAYNANEQIEEAIALLEHVVKIREKTLAETHPDRLASQHTLAVAYHANGQIKEAIALLEHVVRVQETMLAETHPDQLASQHQLAVAYDANRQTEEAISLLEYVVKVQGTTLAETHPDRLVSQHSLATAYYEKGQTEEAVALLEHVVKVKNRVFRKNHPSRLISIQALQDMYARLAES